MQSLNSITLNVRKPDEPEYVAKKYVLPRKKKLKGGKEYLVVFKYCTQRNDLKVNVYRNSRVLRWFLRRTSWGFMRFMRNMKTGDSEQ